MSSFLSFACRLVLAAGLSFAFSPVGALVINEIRIDQPGADRDEFFELAGLPGESLDGVSYLVIGDGAGGSGVVEAVVDLDGYRLSAAGLFVAAEATFNLGMADLVTGLNFENGDNVTHLLVRGFSGALGDDLDGDDDGLLDVQPWEVLLDSVALVDDPSGGDRIYSTTRLGPVAGRVPFQVYRRFDGGDEWVIGARWGSDSPGLFRPAPFLGTPLGQTPLAVAEPAGVVLLGLGLLLLGLVAWRRRSGDLLQY